MALRSNQLSIVMLGASGAVGTETLNKLLHRKNIQQLTLLGRNSISNINVDFVQQHKISISDTSSYQKYLQGHTTAICTLGVGEPSKMSKEEFVKIDKIAVLDLTNRYGIAQAITLKIWPILKPLFIGSLRKYRGISVNVLGQAMARNIFIDGEGYEILQWDEFHSIIK